MFNYGGGCGSFMPSVPVVTTMGNGDNGNGWGDGGIWTLIILFALFGWGGGWGGGFGNGGGGAVQGALTRADLCQDMNFQGVENGVRGVQQGLCDGFYAVNTSLLNGFNGVDNAVCNLGYQTAQLVNGVQNTLNQGFAGLNTGLVTQGYESRLATNDLAAQMAQCCCTTNQNIKDVNTQSVMNTNAIQQQIQSCCCDAEKQTMQTRFDLAQMNCGTLQAIDKLGDRIIDYLCADKMQTLRDENQALRLSASQNAQNTYLINQLRPCPTPAYITCNPWASQSYSGCGGYGYSGGCGCGN